MVLNLIPITGTYSGVLGLYYFYLIVGVGKSRSKAKLPNGDGSQQYIQDIVAKSKEGNDSVANIDLTRYNNVYANLRSQLNFNEFVPYMLILSAVMELHGANSKFLNGLMLTFTLGRVAHAEFGLKAKDFRGYGRLVGALTTMSGIIIGSIGSIYLSNKACIDGYLFK
ncbi:hypothetical protein DLAC_06071 [Tieghemostelium lacteum]|uniref:Uncharacterized protein n=1 Tax=Tieghemostelium lacteum TaxID=361077 RepID=A0A151ZHN4_TIELA|nr:hypothetical protein DLAC_06071 [Tieghemostelium lacteum]|eukprot:KYQ93390.1 hypothetical protein DLAC_06071 [Tieghemostelium lacteum]